MGKQSRCSNFRRRMAASILKCGNNRIWFNPKALKKVNQAITRADVRKLIFSRDIRKRQANLKKTPVLKRKQRAGSRKGSKGARQGKKANWLKIIRPQRRVLNEVKKDLVPGAYRKLYSMVKSGMFRSKAHLKSHMDEKNLLKKE